jgi:mRNA interferase MazF
LIVANLSGDDLILCQITSKTVGDNCAITLGENDFVSGNLSAESNIRPNKLFTADRNIILYKIGQLKPSKLKQVINKITDIFQN